jgi:hypothetical protein
MNVFNEENIIKSGFVPSKPFNYIAKTEYSERCTGKLSG